MSSFLLDTPDTTTPIKNKKVKMSTLRLQKQETELLLQDKRLECYLKEPFIHLSCHEFFTCGPCVEQDERIHAILKRELIISTMTVIGSSLEQKVRDIDLNVLTKRFNNGESIPGISMSNGYRFDNNAFKQKIRRPYKSENNVFFNSISIPTMYKNHRVCLKIFKKGTIHTTGCTSLSMAREIMDNMYAFICQLDSSSLHYRVVMIQTTFNLCTRVQCRCFVNYLTTFHSKESLHVVYDPSLHNAINIKIFGICVLMYCSGKMVITGGKDLRFYVFAILDIQRMYTDFLQWKEKCIK